MDTTDLKGRLDRITTAMKDLDLVAPICPEICLGHLDDEETFQRAVKALGGEVTLHGLHVADERGYVLCSTEIRLNGIRIRLVGPRRPHPDWVVPEGCPEPSQVAVAP